MLDPGITVTPLLFALAPAPLAALAAVATARLLVPAARTDHELVVIKTPAAEAQSPAAPQQAGKVVEDGNIGETGDLAAGEAKPLTLNLEPGAYVLICNQPGHYAAGMHAAFTVK